MSEQFTEHPKDDIEAKGYRSKASKKRFTNYAGVLCIVFFLLQFIVPMVVVFSMMPSMMTNMMRQVEPQTGASWNNFIWYLERGPVKENENFFVEGPGDFKLTLKYLSPDTKKELNPVEVINLDLDKPKLLATHDRLWILTSSYIGYFNDSGLVKVSDSFVLGDISQPFVFNGNPAVIEEHPTGFSLMVFSGGSWRERYSFSEHLGENACCFLNNIKVVSNNGSPMFFYRKGGTLFYREGLPDDSNGRGGWVAMTDLCSSWEAVMLNATPTIFYREQNEEISGSHLVGLRFIGGRWDEFFRHPTGISSKMGIYPFVDGSFAILKTGFPGSFSVISVDNAGNTKILKSGSGSFFPKKMMFTMMTPHLMMMFTPFILALLLTTLMRKYRTVTYTFGPVSAPHASLAKRAVAQIVDAIIMAGPMVIGWLMIMNTMSNMDETPGAPFSVFPSGIILVLGGIIWMLTCLFIYSFMEGRSGSSPGKLLVGIRVVSTDLTPCGFGRAIIRNLLKFVDGFFNFMVGLMVVALSDNWQRIGDMAARTVVIDVKEARKSDLPKLKVELSE